MKDMTDSLIKALIDYALKNSLIEEEDTVYCINRILPLLKKDDFDFNAEAADGTLADILGGLCDIAVQKGLIDTGSVSRDLFDTEIMGVLTARPSQVVKKFYDLFNENKERATDWYYKFSGDTNYIRRDRIAKILKWQYSGEYGVLDITVNLSKPEKDPKAIAAAKNMPQVGYPKCMLCRECEGYAGRIDFPARQNHRIIPITINNGKWFMQYSPYVYYNEHCIVFNGCHTPMTIDKEAFRKLLEFVTVFPHYFLGSNADLPIVGGSILAHEHFQGGRYEFAMERAPMEKSIHFDGFDDVTAGIVKWPMSTIRLQSSNKDSLVELSDKILTKWRGYTDEEAFIFAETESGKHNTVTPIARRRDDLYEIDLVLRNNITTEEHPLGVYHPHAELHHIKKENIGLIEVMGLAVLPPRLKDELEAVENALLNGENLRENPLTALHADWVESFKDNYTFTKENCADIIKKETGKVFSQVLEHAGVFKRDDSGKAAFMRFVESV